MWIGCAHPCLSLSWGAGGTALIIGAPLVPVTIIVGTTRRSPGSVVPGRTGRSRGTLIRARLGTSPGRLAAPGSRAAPRSFTAITLRPVALRSRARRRALSRPAITFALPASPSSFAVTSLGTRLNSHDGVLAAHPQEALLGLLDDFDIDSLTIGNGQLLHRRGDGYLDSFPSDLYPINHDFTSSCDVGAGQQNQAVVWPVFFLRPLAACHS